jgi:hypothetical protein
MTYSTQRNHSDHIIFFSPRTNLDLVDFGTRQNKMQVQVLSFTYHMEKENSTNFPEFFYL